MFKQRAGSPCAEMQKLARDATKLRELKGVM